MKTLNKIVGENLSFLRKKAGFTQLEMGEKFNYSDKTVSKWEQGDVVPSVEVLKQIADFFHVSVDYLLEEHTSEKEFNSIIKKTPNYKRKATLLALVITIVYTIAMTIYIASIYNMDTANVSVNRWWSVFLWAAPISFLILTYGTRKFFKSNLWSCIFMSAFVWTILASAYITFFNIGNYWYLFFIGIPVQVSLILIYRLRA